MQMNEKNIFIQKPLKENTPLKYLALIEKVQESAFQPMRYLTQQQCINNGVIK